MQSLFYAMGLLIYWADFRDLYQKYAEDFSLETNDWKRLSDVISLPAHEAIQHGQIIVVATAQVAGNLLKDVDFDTVINDKASVSTMFENLMARKDEAKLILIGDPQQMGPTVMTSKESNPMHKILKHVLISPWTALNLKTYKLKMQCWMTAGQADLVVACFYDHAIQVGPGTELVNNRLN